MTAVGAGSAAAAPAAADVDDAAFQQAFAAGLLDDGPAASGHPLAAQPGYAVYRNTVARGLVDALAANFPTVRSLLGEDAFHAVARDHARAEPPRDASLAGYGVGFAAALGDWIAREGATDELPYLVDVARLDRAWTEAHLAADAEPLALAALAAVDPDALLALRLAPHPALRRVASAATPAFTIWRRHREGGDPGEPLDWRAEAAMLVRPGAVVGWHPLSMDDLPMLDALAAGSRLGDALACGGAGEAEPVDRIPVLAGWIAAGAFRRGLPA